MKPQMGVYEVTIGISSTDIQAENMRGIKLLAIDVRDVLGKIKLGRNEYISKVELVTRLDN